MASVCHLRESAYINSDVIRREIYVEFWNYLHGSQINRTDSEM
jgi:hypothetical protein